MTNFDAFVSQAISQNAEYPTLRNVIEKELLHYDILRCMNEAGFLKNLTFMGGTCLRDCYGSPRLSEDLDFTGGFDFSKESMKEFGSVIERTIRNKYSLPVTVTEPTKETGNTETWKIKIITRPERPDFPAQKINIDICMLPSHQRKVLMIKNRYGVNMGMDGTLLYAESLSEILCDKLIAFARRPNRVKNRDLWDIHWLSQKNVNVNKDLLLQKLNDRRISESDFWQLYKNRLAEIKSGQKDFLFEMRRFLIPSAFSEQFTSEMWWEYLINLLGSLFHT
ncbi:MAG: nucleotidyl transferase AbiEii/AbiGii toxin family protein [Spirochaetaceae bacterium]|nr:nucleotidyl transferase AbiEii/AbiGii toxin family protein [Spirochaetaceae bacterium]